MINILDERLKSMEVESRKFLTSEISEGEFEGEWTAKSKKKKVRRNVAAGIVYIKATFNNTTVTVNIVITRISPVF